MRHLSRALGAVLAVASFAIVSPVAAAAPDAKDRATMHTYLSDLYAYGQMVLGNAPASKADLEAAVGGLDAECRGVLTGAPQEPSLRLPPEESKIGPRQRGEQNRVNAQLQDLESEAGSVVTQATALPSHSAALALAAELRSLQWGTASLGLYAREEADGIEEDVNREAPAACADMRFWVASGYKILSPASKALVERSENPLARLPGHAQRELAEDLPALFKLPASEALLHKILQVSNEAQAITGSTYEIEQRLDLTLGLSAGEQLKLPEELSHPHAHAVRIAHGKTAAGTSYAIWVKSEHVSGGGCFELEIERGNGSSSGSCGSSSDVGAEASVECMEGALTVESRTLPATRRVVLRLSDGRKISSRPGIIPKRLGGHGGVYYQAVRGPSPIPVELIELGAKGKLLRTVKLRRVVECTKHPLKYLNGGVRVLVRASTPRGPSFDIVAERYRYLGHVYFELKLAVGAEAIAEVGGGEERHGLPFDGGRPFGGLRHRPFEQNLETGCHPYEHAIVYGLLRKSRDTVLVKVAGKLEPLRRVRIPASMHAGGALVYAALGSAPEAIVVRTPSGKTVQSEDMSSQSKQTRETCEGEAEGAGPTVGQDNNGSISFGEIG